jgi:hypothetical protein
MKKIVGIIAAVAMAASVFAVDFSAGFQLKGNLFQYDEADGARALNLNTSNSKDDKPFVFSVSGDRAGGQLKLFTSEGKTANDAVEFDAQALNIWFKPFDAVRVDLGNTDFGLNCEQITWWKGKLFGTDDWGFKATYSADAIEVALFLSAKNASWFDSGRKAAYDAAYAASKIAHPAADADNPTAAEKAQWESDAVAARDNAKAALAEMALKFGYNADFGNISAIFDATNTFKTLKFGAGYKGSFGASSVFTDVLFTKADAANAIAFDVDYKYSDGPITAEIYTAVKASNLSNFGNTMTIPVYFKGAYALDAGTVYLKFLDDNMKASDFAGEFELGFDGNLGAIAYNVAANYNVANKVFAVPFWVRLSF